jgi:hypothetical protein
MPNMSKIFNYCLSMLAIGLTNIIICNPSQAVPRTMDAPSTFKPNNSVYIPILFPQNGEVKDTLSEKDIPNGDGGFARDYALKLTAGDRIEIDLSSEMFDTVVILLGPDGKNIAKNDDGADGSSNSLLFTKIKESGNYTIRVQGFGDTSSGDFKLKVSRLKPQ